jgi:hypothetical protein
LLILKTACVSGSSANAQQAQSAVTTFQPPQPELAKHWHGVSSDKKNPNTTSMLGLVTRFN